MFIVDGRLKVLYGIHKGDHHSIGYIKCAKIES